MKPRQQKRAFQIKCGWLPDVVSPTGMKCWAFVGVTFTYKDEWFTWMLHLTLCQFCMSLGYVGLE